MPAFLSVSTFHGPVTQKAAWPLRKACLRGAVVDLRVDQAVLVPPVDQLRVLRGTSCSRRRCPTGRGCRPCSCRRRSRRDPRRTGTCGTRRRPRPAGRRWRGCRFFFLNASADFSSCANVVGHLGELRVHDQADVLERDRGAVEPLDGGAVRERVERVRRELRPVALRGKSGSTRPLAASSPVQSWAPTITSGASSAWTVLRSSRMLPKSFCDDLDGDAAASPPRRPRPCRRRPCGPRPTQMVDGGRGPCRADGGRGAIRATNVSRARPMTSAVLRLLRIFMLLPSRRTRAARARNVEKAVSDCVKRRGVL